MRHLRVGVQHGTQCELHDVASVSWQYEFCCCA